jgi:hypothetical protein
LKLSSRDVTVISAMAVIAAVCHIVVGPAVNTSFHIPGPTLAGPVIIAPIMIAGAVTQKKGVLTLTNAINGLVLSFFVPIGFLAFPIFIVGGLVLDAFYVKLLNKLFSPAYSFLAGGVSNAVAVLLIAIFGMGMLMGKGMHHMGASSGMQPSILLAIITVVGFIAGGVGGLIASSITPRIQHMYPAKAQ